MDNDTRSSPPAEKKNPYAEMWRRAFDYKGTSGRKDFWIPFAVNAAIAVCAAVLSLIMLPLVGWIAVALWAYLAVCVVPFASLTVRRLHDTGRSGWWYFLVFAAGVGSVVLGIMLAGASGTFRADRNLAVGVYGPPEYFEGKPFDPSDNLIEPMYGPPPVDSFIGTLEEYIAPENDENGG